MMRPIGFEAVGPPATTLNPADTSASVTLSGGNLTALRNAVSADRWVSSRATTSKSAGKWYLEGTGLSTNFAILGAAAASFNVDDGASQCYMGSNNLSVGFDNFNGYIFTSGGIVATADDWTAVNSVAGAALDLDNDLYWFRKNPTGNWNGNPSADPATATGGLSLPAALAGANLVFPGVSVYAESSNPSKIKINFGAAAFSGAVPGGFAAWT